MTEVTQRLDADEKSIINNNNNNNLSVDRYISAHQKMQPSELVVMEKRRILYACYCSLVISTDINSLVFQVCIIKA